MKNLISAVGLSLMLAACGATVEQQAQLAAAGETLTSIAAANSTTVASLLKQGTLICGEESAVKGQLLVNDLAAVANDLGHPVTVAGMQPEDVAKACAAIGRVAGPLPAGVDPATVPVVPVATALPPAV